MRKIKINFFDSNKTRIVSTLKKPKDNSICIANSSSKKQLTRKKLTQRLLNHNEGITYRFIKNTIPMHFINIICAFYKFTKNLSVKISLDLLPFINQIVKFLLKACVKIGLCILFLANEFVAILVKLSISALMIFLFLVGVVVIFTFLGELGLLEDV